MSFFDENDPFESFVKEIFGESTGPVKRNRTIIQGDGEDRTIDFIEGERKVYALFELLGYNEEEITVSVKGRELGISARAHTTDDIQPYLVKKLNRGQIIRKSLPAFVNPKKFEHSIRNGVLEIIFEKVRGER